MKKREAFISLKDHKENFQTNPKCRLINPAKSDSGKISKSILDRLNTKLRTILNVNQWRNTQNVIEWFGSIEEKTRHSFISFDIVDFYPSISENLLDQALSWASNLADISDEDISIIKHARKSLLFNHGRNTVKVSYSCMNNVKSIITSHNTRIIRKSQPQDISAENCNCRNKHTCPLQNKCMSKDIVYKATILTGNTQDTKHYIGMTSNTFKERYRNHIKSFTHKKYSNETELSKHVWHLKQKKTDFTIKWSIIKKSISYTGGSKRCNLCLEEKISILKEKNNCLLNKRSEIVSACQHKSRFQVNNLNKERNACYSTTHAPTFPP